MTLGDSEVALNWLSSLLLPLTDQQQSRSAATDQTTIETQLGANYLTIISPTLLFDHCTGPNRLIQSVVGKQEKFKGIFRVFAWVGGSV